MRSWIHALLNLAPLLAVVAALWGAGVLILRSRSVTVAAWPAGRVAALWLLGCWLSGMLLLTLLPGVVSAGVSGLDDGRPRADLIPFRAVLTEGPGLGGIAVLERLANVAMFGVGGVLIAATCAWGVRRTALACGALALAIEAAQWLGNSGRAATVDDVLAALLGGAAGAAVVALSRRVTASPAPGLRAARRTGRSGPCGRRRSGCRAGPPGCLRGRR